MNTQSSLVQQYRRWLAAAFMSLELLLAALFLVFLVLPQAKRSANDLAGLMVMSAQTWAELQPAMRADFERNLRVNHGLELRPARMESVQSEPHSPFIRLLEKALQQRISENARLEREWRDGQAWYWIHVPLDSGQLAVGLAQNRYDSRPLLILGIGLLISFFMAWGVANWLARRIVAPLQNLSQAMSVVGQGGSPQALPETGPQELAALSRHFNAMVHQVQSLLGARTTLLAGISHDLRTPLARMRLSLELLRDAPSALYLDHLERDIGQMNQLIGQVLGLARGLESEPHQRVCLPDFLTELADEFDLAQSPSMSEPALEGVVHAPPLALRRALGNLLENALRYAPANSVVLACEALPSGCRVGVLDRGPGIPAEKMALMLEPFQRLEVSRSPVTGGVGLGLAIVKALAMANGWQLDLSNRHGGGLQAWLVLPA